MKKTGAARLDSAKVLVCLFLLFVPLVGVSAQPDDDTITHEVGVWGGFSPDSNTVFRFGRSADARYGTVAVQYARRFHNNDKVNLKYTVDFVPAAVLDFNDLRFVPTLVPTGGNTFREERFRKTAYAWGVAPLGLQVNFRPAKKAQPFVGAAGGFLYFNKQVPNDFGTKFNFTLDVGGGVEFNLKNKRAVTVGYKYHHISNGYRGEFNPGYDNNLFYVGYRFFSK